MKAAGYRADTAAAVNASAATIGAIMSPSLPIVIFGVTSDISVGWLFLARLVPGVLMAAITLWPPATTWLPNLMLGR